MCPYSAQPAHAVPVTTLTATGHRPRTRSAATETPNRSQVSQSAWRWEGSLTAASAPVSTATTAATARSVVSGDSGRRGHRTRRGPGRAGLGEGTFRTIGRRSAARVHPQEYASPGTLSQPYSAMTPSASQQCVCPRLGPGAVVRTSRCCQ